MGTINMDDIYDKENMSPMDRSETVKNMARLTPSPNTRKPRSRSLGLGDLDGPHELQKRSSPERNRRKSAFPKSNLPSREEEAARKAARRKSLANRRVSFAPEATLHTWDVVEYMREATTSTASSEERRRSQANHSPTRDDDNDLELPVHTSDAKSPGKQRFDRRSSGIPPMNFNNPDEILSSSPANGSSPDSDNVEDSEEDGEDVAENPESDDDDEDGAMSLISTDDTGEITLHSEASDIMSDSSARLDAVLRQATFQATTQNIQFESLENMTMDLVTEQTVQLSPWARTGVAMTPMAKNLMAVQEQENINPFSPAFRAHAGARRRSIIEDLAEDVSMDMTRVIGAILPQPAMDEQEMSLDDATMELTQADGQIRETAVPTGLPRIVEQRSPEHSPDRPAKRRKTDEVMCPNSDILFAKIPEADDLTQSMEQDTTMDMTLAIGGIVDNRSPSRKSRRSSVARRRSVRQSMDSLEPTMEFTTAIGSIRPLQGDRALEAPENVGHGDSDMEKAPAAGITVPTEMSHGGPSTPKLSHETLKNAPSTPTDQDRFKDMQDMSAKKMLTPIFEDQKQSPESRVTRSSSKRARVSMQSPRLIGASPLCSQQDRVTGETLVEPFAGLDRALAAVPMQLISQTADHEVNHGAELVKRRPSLAAKKQSTREAVSPQVQAQKQGSNQYDLSENLRLLSTPRKNAASSPAKRADTTPKRGSARSTPRKTITPRSVRSNRKVVKQHAQSVSVGNPLQRDIEAILQQHPEASTAQLGDFIQATGLNFMDLKTNKRDLVATPSRLRRDRTDSHTLETAIVASTCSIPELCMFEHACEQLTHFMAEGKGFFADLEQQVKVNGTPFLRVYGQAEDQVKARFDEHIKSVRAKARNGSKQIWYGWRDQLLENVQQNLRQSRTDLESDSDLISERERLVAAFLPSAMEQAGELERRTGTLEASLKAASTDEQERLRELRRRLAGVNASLRERQIVGQGLESAVLAKSQQLSRLRLTKSESLATLQKARNLMEKCRAVPLVEISRLADKVDAIERSCGWTIDSVHGSSITMTHSDLQLFFDTTAFANSDESSQTRRARATRAPDDRPISLVFIPSEEESNPLSTERRFFLQLLQAHVQTIVQRETRIKDLLSIISETWASACTLQETLHKVRIEHPVDVQILSDERLGVSICILLPKVQTKVCVEIEICANIVSVEGRATAGIKTEVEVRGRVVYGEQYKESAIAAVVRKGVGSGLRGWDAPVRELRERLIAFGRKA